MKPQKTTSRRKFLLAAGLGSAGAAAAVATGLKASGETPSSQQAEQTTQGYRATDHVLKYYKTTEV